MKILDVRHAVPRRLVTNDDVLRALHDANAGHFTPADLTTLETRVRRFLDHAGTRDRHVLAEGERAIDVALPAARAALADGVDPGSIDFVVFAGVTRGWLDPAMAHVFAHELRIDNASCFDVVDGCASWLRALEISQALLRTGRYQRGLVLNCECGVERYADFRLESLADLEHRFAMLTIGEAATATLLESSGDDDCLFAFKSFPAHYQLAMLGLDAMPSFLTEATDPRCEPLKFFALSNELIPLASRKVVEMFEESPMLRERAYDICFTHAASERASKWVLNRLAIPWDRHVSTHPSFGNTVAASIPLAMSLALRDGRLQRGNHMLAIAASAGITVGFGAFTF